MQIEIKDTSFLCIGAIPEGGNNDLTLRFMRHFNLVCFPNPRGLIINHIFSQILDSYFRDFDEGLKGFSQNIVSATIEFYEKILIEKLPTPSKFHYTFNLRDLSKVFMGLSLIRGQKVTNSTQIV